MKVICPKCQFENQADSTRVVCARCATIIEVRVDQPSGLEGNGKRQTARLPFAAKPGNSQTSNSQSQPLNSQQLNQSRDVYATRIGDDFDDVLDIPRPAQPNYQTSYEATTDFDDVFTTPSYDSTENYDFAGGERKPVPVDNFQGNPSHPRETQDYVTAAEPEFMGWPVLPESAIEEEEPASSFSAGRGGLLIRIALCTLVFGGLVFGAYYFLGDLISKRKGQPENIVANKEKEKEKEGNNQPATNPPANGGNAETKQNEVVKAEKPATESPKTVVDPKPSGEKSQPANTTIAKNGSKPVDIPPVTGNAGHSDAPKPAVIPTTPNKGNMTLQVASFNDQAQANDRVARLKSAGVDARVVRADIPGKGTWYRVQIGAARTREEATNFGNQLKAKGVLSEFIVTTIGK